jgi:hypothetical protein
MNIHKRLNIALLSAGLLLLLLNIALVVTTTHASHGFPLF